MELKEKAVTKPRRQRSASSRGDVQGGTPRKGADLAPARGSASAATVLARTPGEDLQGRLGELVRRGQRQRRALIDQLAVVLTPTTQPVVDDGLVLQARRNAELRQRLLREHAVVTSAQVAEMAGSAARNKAALAAGWRKDGRIFGVPLPTGEYVFPTVQFDDVGHPRSDMRILIGVFPKDAREWQLFAWLATPNGWLAGALPFAVLQSDADAVVKAASQEFDGSRW
jgi:hypothetical protein